MKPVNKLDDIWEFEKFIQSIINSALEVGSILLKWEDSHYLSLDQVHPLIRRVRVFQSAVVTTHVIVSPYTVIRKSCTLGI